MSRGGGDEPTGSRAVGRSAAIAVVIGLGVLGLATHDSVLRGGIAWLGFLLAIASGWGYIVARFARVADPDFGLRATWGLAGYLAVTGLLISVGLCTRPVILGLIAIGAGGFAWRELTTTMPISHRLRDGLRYARANPALGVLAVVMISLAVFNAVGAVAMLDRNPWDDDLAYTPLIKRLLDVGNLVEPFSFRRLGAYGGQTALGALAGARGVLANVHLIDRGLCQLLVLLLAAGYARERRTHVVYVLLIALVVLLLPETAINTAAAWSGVAMFLALYRTVVRGHWGLVGLVGAATCTLRQNYLAVVVLFVAVALLARLFAARRAGRWAEAWRIERPCWTRTLGVALLVIIPWWIAAERSSGTFLFPLVDGTWNHALSVKPAVMSWAEELAYVLWSSIETTPLTIIPVLFAVLCVISDRRPARPLHALFIGVTLGFVLLVHGFAGTEPFHLWRYAFGFSLALAIVLAIEAGAVRDDDAGNDSIRLIPLGRWLLISALVLQILGERGALPKQFAGLASNLREAAALDRHGDPIAAAEAARYRELQASLPAGAHVAVMLDDPWMLDFTRNQVANLDTPGFASTGTQLPSFRGPEALRSYLVAQGYRYVAFVRSDRSRYFFRRPFWVWRLFNDGELFAIMSAYTIDMIESFASLSTTTNVLHDKDGLVALDLGNPTAVIEPAAGTEAERRDAFVRALADREGLHTAWSLTTRDNLRFEDGVAGLAFVDGGGDDPEWFEITHPKTPEKLRGTATRALYRRAHLRVRGSSSMMLSIRAKVALNTVYTRPRLDISLEGELLASAVADAHGQYVIEVRVPADKLAGGWKDLYLVSSSVAEPEANARDPRVARLELVEWRPLP